MLNSIWLNTFKTLVDVGHFTQAAEKLYMTQPGVSQQIKKLESACGYPLIKRIKKSFELTEQGRMIYEYASQMLKTEEKVMNSLGFDDSFDGKCLLSCSGSLALLIYPILLSLQQQHPKLTFHIEAAPNHKILSDIDDGHIDLGIVTHIPNSSLYQNTILGNETLCLILPQSYQGQTITAELLFECGLVSHPDAKHYLSLYFDLCGNSSLAEMNINELPTISYINQLGQILLPISKGIGFTVLPKSAVESFAEKETLYIVEELNPVEETLYLVQKRNRTLPKRYETVKMLLQQVLKDD